MVKSTASKFQIKYRLLSTTLWGGNFNFSTGEFGQLSLFTQISLNTQRNRKFNNSKTMKTQIDKLSCYIRTVLARSPQ